MTKITRIHWSEWLDEDNARYFASCAQDAGMSIGDFVKRELVGCFGWTPADKGFDEIAKHCAAQISQQEYYCASWMSDPDKRGQQVAEAVEAFIRVMNNRADKQLSVSGFNNAMRVMKKQSGGIE